MITAMEIRDQQFSKKIRGYDEEEVKNFLIRLAGDYENLYSENSRLQENIEKVQFELEKYRKMEETMNNSLILAQRTAEEVKANAHREADLFLAEAKQKITGMLGVYQDIVKRLNIFSAELKAQLNGQIDMLDKHQQKLDELSDFFCGRYLKEQLENLEKISPGGEADAQGDGSQNRITV